MKAIRITTQGFGAIDLSTDLAGADLFEGPNGAGKSTRLQALCWCLAGIVHLQGRTMRKASDIFHALCPGSGPGREMRVRVDFDDGSHAERVASIDRRNKVACPEPPGGERFAGLHLLLSAGELLGLSDAKRRKKLFQLSAAVLLPEQAGALVDAWAAKHLETDLRESAAWKEARGKLGAEPGEGVDGWLELVLHELDEQRRDAAAAETEAQGTVQRLTDELHEAREAAGHVDPVRLEQDRQDARDAVEQLAGDLARAEERERQAAPTVDRLAAVDRRMLELGRRPQVDLGALEAEMAELQAREYEPGPDLDKLRAESDAADERLRLADEAHRALEQEVSALEGQQEGLQGYLDRLSEGGCPFGGDCPAQAGKCEELGKWISGIDEQFDALQGRLDAADAEVDAAQSAALTAGELLQAAEARLDREERQRSADQVRVRELAVAIRAELAARDEESRLTAEQETLTEQHALHEAEEPAEAITRRLGDARGHLAMLEEGQRAMGRLELLEVEVASAAAARDEADARHAELKDLLVALGPKGLQGHILREPRVLAPFTEALQAVLDEARPGCRAAIQWLSPTGSEVCRIGWEDTADRFVAAESLSGGQRGSFDAALIRALARVLRELPFRPVLLDDLEHIDADARAAMLAELLRAQEAGELDNIIGGWCTAALRRVDSYEAHWLGDPRVLVEDETSDGRAA